LAGGARPSESAKNLAGVFERVFAKGIWCVVIIALCEGLWAKAFAWGIAFYEFWGNFTTVFFLTATDKPL
jgi:hypothetical protein